MTSPVAIKLPKVARLRSAAAPTQMCVQRVNNPTDFAAAMPPQASRALVVFSFVAANCRACRYASRAFRRMADEITARGDGVRFCEMDVTERQNQRLCRDLGVEAVPAFQFYVFRNQGREQGVGVLDEVVGPRNVGVVRRKVDEYSKGGFDIGEYVFEEG